MTERTTLAELFEMWITAKVTEDGIKPQTVHQYRTVWKNHGVARLGALRIGELPTSRANAHIQVSAQTAPSQAGYLRIVLRGMYGMAVRFDVLATNPIVETRNARTVRKPARAVTAAEFDLIRESVATYAKGQEGIGGPKPGRLLPAFVEMLLATGARPNEVLALRWSDIDLLADPPTATINGTLIDHQRVPGRALHRQDARKSGAPAHTVLLPKFGVEALTGLVGQSGMDGPVFASRCGGWVSLSNMRRALRAALPEDLAWVTPHSFRRSVATVVRDALGPEKAQQQLSHAKLSTTEAHYLERHTHGPDVRATLERFAGHESGERK